MILRLILVASVGLVGCAKESAPSEAPYRVADSTRPSPVTEAASPAPAPMEAPAPRPSGPGGARHFAVVEPMPASTPSMPVAPPAVAMPTGGAAAGYVDDATVNIDGVAREGQQAELGAKALAAGQMALALRKEAATADTSSIAGDGGEAGPAANRQQARFERKVDASKPRPKSVRPSADAAGWDAPVEPDPVAAEPMAPPPEKPAEEIPADANAVVGGTALGKKGAFAANVAEKSEEVEAEEQDEEDKDLERAEVTGRDRVENRRSRGGPRRARVAPRVTARPTSFMPDFFYFENTYLGGDAGYRESLRRLDRALADVGAPHRLARLPEQGFDAPARDGLGLLATATSTVTDGSGRVFLQVGLRGSDRHGWRRPPLEVVVVLDSARLGDASADAVTFIETVLTRLGPQDRVAILAAGQDRPIATLGGLRQHRNELLPRLEEVLRAVPASGSLPGAMTRAGWTFVEASRARTTAPGTQVLLLLTRADRDPSGVAAEAAPVASQLALGGVVTSVVGLTGRPDDAALWTIAAAGHGNAHTAVAGQPESVVASVDAELELLSRVVARLVRVNVKLAPGVKAVRVLGSRPLLDEEVRVVKAREVETDRRLSQVLGITADRGDDDDGIQTVIPVFYGGDAHVIVLELWAEGPGPIADVTLRYKDMVNLDNRSARTSVSVRGQGRDDGGADPLLASTRDALLVGDALRSAAASARTGDLGGAILTLDQASGSVPTTYGALLRRAARGELDTSSVVESLELAARRAVGGGG